MDRILLAEDEATGRRILSTYLRQAGYVVDEVEDGKEAWERLQHQRDYALVVSDRRMPNMNGLELAQKVQADLELRRIPILMQTSANTPEEVVEGIRVGVYYYLTKPYVEETLLSLVKAGIRERRQRERFASRINRQQEALGAFVRGEFRIRKLDEAQNIAFLLGNLFPKPDMVVTGLYELLLNAIEHGNLAIGYQEKARLLSAGRWEDEIARRMQMPEYANRQVIVQFAQDATQLEVNICDQGAGFDWRPYMDIEPARATQASGRGIAKANHLCFDSLTYLGNGNQVKAITRLAASSQPLKRVGASG